MEPERSRLDAALDRAASELHALQNEVSKRLGPSQAEVLGTQLLALEDRDFRDQVLHIIEGKRVNAEAALSEVIDGYTRRLDGVPDTYLRERAADVRDVGRRVLSSLIERQSPTVRRFRKVPSWSRRSCCPRSRLASSSIACEHS